MLRIQAGRRFKVESPECLDDGRIDFVGDNELEILNRDTCKFKFRRVFFQVGGGPPDDGINGSYTLSRAALSEQAVLQCLAALPSGRRCMMKLQFRRNIAEERRGRQGAELTAPGALQGAAEEQAVLGTRYVDVEQAALLGVRAAFVRHIFGP